jgi:hypothetical protein
MHEEVVVVVVVNEMLLLPLKVRRGGKRVCSIELLVF